MVDWSRLVLELRKHGISDSRIAKATGRSRRWVWDLANNTKSRDSRTG